MALTESPPAAPDPPDRRTGMPVRRVVAGTQGVVGEPVELRLLRRVASLRHHCRHRLVAADPRRARTRCAGGISRRFGRNRRACQLGSSRRSPNGSPTRRYGWRDARSPAATLGAGPGHTGMGSVPGRPRVGPGFPRAQDLGRAPSKGGSRPAALIPAGGEGPDRGGPAASSPAGGRYLHF